MKKLITWALSTVFALTLLVGSSTLGALQAATQGRLTLIDLYDSQVTQGNDLTFEFEQNAAGVVSIQLLTGAAPYTLVQDIALNLYPAGPSTFSWNSGSTPAGNYVIRVAAVDANGFVSQSDFVQQSFSVAQSQSNSNQITSVYVNPNPVQSGNSARIHFTQSQSGTYSIWILDSAWPNSVIANVASSQNAAAGNNSVLWDGRDNNGNQLPAGSYVAEVAAIDSVNGGYFSVDRAQFTVTSGGSVTPNPTELIRNLTAQSPIVRSQSSSIAFTLDQSATVTAYIRQGNSSLGSVVRTLNNSNMSSGNKNLLWDSRNDSGNLVSSGDYTLEIFTTNSSGQRSTSQTRLIRVQDQSVNPPYNGNFTLNSFSATSSFNPYRSNQKASISFSANRGYSDLADFNLEIFALNGNQFVKRLADLRSVSANGSYTYTWDGTDSRGAFVPCGTYYVYLKAQSGNESFADSRTIQVCDDYIGPNYPQPLPPVPLPIRKDDLCAGFIDVARASKDCSIIAFVHDMGVFEGYADGSFRPNQPINRAELTKVVLLSFGYKIANYNGSYLFSDIDPRSWYAPYLNTALNEGIITGYPNGTFAPEKTISRAEMLKVFFAASPDQSVSFCQFQPFADTPVEPATFWFVHYVCQAKSMGILPELNNYFYPHDAMTRLDAARLFYHYAQAKN